MTAPVTAAAGPAPDVAIAIRGLAKRYAGGHQALKPLDLDIHRGEIFALLGPNGAGKTTLISIVCGLVTPSEGTVSVDGHDIVRDYRASRARIGLVPQELSGDAFSTVAHTVSFSRGLFGKPRNPALIETLLRELSLWDKRDARLMTLSGGMKRRVMIAKALSHEPDVLFLDEPTAGVDVELRHDMWRKVRELQQRGVTIILTTHYIEEAEEMADRIGVIHQGELRRVQEKAALMKELGKRTLTVELEQPLAVSGEGALPEPLMAQGWRLPAGVAPDAAGVRSLVRQIEQGAQAPGVGALLAQLAAQGLVVKDVQTHQSSLEEIFVDLVRQPAASAAPTAR